MGVTPVELAIFCRISDDIAGQVKKFLLGEAPEDTRFERKSSISSSGSEERFCPETELKEDVAQWDDWGDKEPETSKENDESLWNWLFRCDVRTYFDAEYILITWESRFILLRKPPDDTYRIVCKQWINGDPVASEISCSCIFGLPNKRHSDQIDCLILTLGTVDGTVYFYTEKGTLLFYDRFSIDEPVRNVQFEAVNNSQVLLVVFSKTFFLINSIPLNSVLHRSKMQIATATKTAQELSETLDLQCELIKPDVKSDILHVVFTGMYQPSSFERYATATWESFNARVERPSLPIYSTFLVTTEKCFVSFIWHNKDEQDQIWNEAIKYGKSLLPSFGIRKYFGISTEPAKKFPHMLTAYHAPSRSRILDTRVAQRVARSPDSRYVAIVDRMARVVVVDVLFRTVVLVFKGYRDASISWVSTVEGKRFAQFLVIFAPRRSLLEVWTVLGNVRVCAHHVTSSECDIISGGESSMLCSPLASHVPQSTFFVNEKGELQRIVLPFYLTLNGLASQNQHDQLLMRKIDKLDVLSKQWFETFGAFKLANSRRSVFHNALGSLNSPADAHTFLVKIRTISAAQSLGNLPNAIEKGVGLYQRIVNTERESRNELVEESIKDPISRKIIQVHFEMFDGKMEEMGIGEFLRFVDFEGENDVFGSNWTNEMRCRLANLIFSPLFSCQDHITYIEDVVEKLPFSIVDIAKLLAVVFDNSPPAMTWKSFENLGRLLEELEFKQNECLNCLDETIRNSKNISESIVLLGLCWVAKNRRLEKEKEETKKGKVDQEEEDSVQKEEEEEEEVEAWDTIAPEMEHLDSMLQCLHCVYLAQKIGKVEMPRLVDTAQRIDTFCREMVAKWVVANDVESEMIEKLFPSDPTEEIAEDTSEEVERKALLIEIPEAEEEVVQRMVGIMPRTFEHDLVVADICWEMMCMWFREKHVNFYLLEKCTNLLTHSLVDVRLRHGITRLIWDKFIGAAFESIVMLVEKTARAPKERDVRKEVGISESRVVEFLVECEKLLQCLMDASRDLPVAAGGGIEYRCDEVVEMATSAFAARLEHVTTRQDQLATIAIRQPVVNYHLVVHHYHLALALRLQLTVGMRLHTLRSLFCLVGNRAFFVRLDSHPLIPLERVDDAVLERRHAFLTKISEQGSTEERRLAKILEGEWNLTVNAISFMQALSAYRIGQDGLGSRYLACCVRDDRSFSALARLLAARIARLVAEEKKVLTTSHSDYLHSIAADEPARIELAEPTDEVSDYAPDPQTWRESVASLGKAIACLSISTQAALPFLRLNDIAQIYCGISFM